MAGPIVAPTAPTTWSQRAPPGSEKSSKRRYSLLITNRRNFVYHLAPDGRPSKVNQTAGLRSRRATAKWLSLSSVAAAQKVGDDRLAGGLFALISSDSPLDPLDGERDPLEPHYQRREID